MEKEYIEEIVIGAIEDIASINIEDKNSNLFGDIYNIMPRDMIYIVFEIEKKLGKEVSHIFETEDIGIMTVNNLVDCIKGCTIK